MHQRGNPQPGTAILKLYAAAERDGDEPKEGFLIRLKSFNTKKTATRLLTARPTPA